MKNKWQRTVLELVVKMVSDVQDGYSFEIQPLIDIISKLLKTQRDEMVEKIKGMKVNQSNKGRTNPLTKHKWWFNNGYDSALDQVIQLLKEKK